jgi:hypothetical protein
MNEHAWTKLWPDPYFDPYFDHAAKGYALMKRGANDTGIG